jgi:hypothetical protein
MDLNYFHLEMKIGEISKCSGFSLMNNALIIVIINILHHHLKALNSVNTAKGKVYVAYRIHNEMFEYKVSNSIARTSARVGRVCGSRTVIVHVNLLDKCYLFCHTFF